MTDAPTSSGPASSGPTSSGLTGSDPTGVRLTSSGHWRAVAEANRLLRGDGTLAATIFAEMSALAVRTGAINLGQGFPDTDGPRVVLDAAIEAIRTGADTGANQYPPGRGIPALRRAISLHQKRFYDIDLDPDREVLVTTGATEAIASAILALCSPGDEVVMLEPTYDSYTAVVELAGATARTVPLRFPDYALDPQRLRAAFGPRTRMVLLNTPHNPTGRVLSRAELDLIAQLARAHDTIVVSDEVYEHLIFDGAQHIPISTLPDMAERTLTISSAGKTFSVTGWKIGWVTGPAVLIDAVTTIKQFLSYVSGGPFQPAVASALALPDNVFQSFAQSLAARRDLLADGLTDAGMTVSRPAGGYFIVADVAPLGFTNGADACRRLPELAGVVAVPVSVFHTPQDLPHAASLVRFAFCKRPEVLTEAATRLRALAN